MRWTPVQIGLLVAAAGIAAFVAVLMLLAFVH